MTRAVLSMAMVGVAFLIAVAGAVAMVPGGLLVGAAKLLSDAAKRVEHPKAALEAERGPYGPASAPLYREGDFPNERFVRRVKPAPELFAPR